MYSRPDGERPDILWGILPIEWVNLIQLRNDNDTLLTRDA